MMVKLMLMPLLTGMLLGNYSKFQIGLCSSPVFTGYSLSYNKFHLLSPEENAPRSRFWLAPSLTEGSPFLGSTPEHLHTHSTSKRDGKHRPWVVLVPCAQTYLTTWYCIIIVYLSVSFINDDLQQRHKLFFSSLYSKA